jgi:hypothetical protein
MAQNYTVSGNITGAGAASGVMVFMVLWGVPDAPLHTAISNASGAFTLSLPPGEYLAGGRVYGFSVVFRDQFVDVRGNVTGLVMETEPRPRIDVSGTINGAPNNSALIEVSIGPYVATTNSAGFYSVNVPTGQTTISPRLQHWTFQPSVISGLFTVASGNQANNNFTAIAGERRVPKFNAMFP